MFPEDALQTGTHSPLYSKIKCHNSYPKENDERERRADAHYAMCIFHRDIVQNEKDTDKFQMQVSGE